MMFDERPEHCLITKWLMTEHLPVGFSQSVPSSKPSSPGGTWSRVWKMKFEGSLYKGLTSLFWTPFMPPSPADVSAPWIAEFHSCSRPPKPCLVSTALHWKQQLLYWNLLPPACLSYVFHSPPSPPTFKTTKFPLKEQHLETVAGRSVHHILWSCWFCYWVLAVKTITRIL